MHYEGKITNGECIAAMKEMASNKSPGNDGLSVEFYILFWPLIGNLVVDSVNSAFGKKELSSSQKQAVISLIHKEGKDPLFIKNYRPISLLNVDYKILTVLNDLISVDQVGYLKDRNIGEAIRMIDDIIHHTLVN